MLTESRRRSGLLALLNFCMSFDFLFAQIIAGDLLLLCELFRI